MPKFVTAKCLTKLKYLWHKNKNWKVKEAIWMKASRISSWHWILFYLALWWRSLLIYATQTRLHIRGAQKKETGDSHARRSSEYANHPERRRAKQISVRLSFSLLVLPEYPENELPQWQQKIADAENNVSRYWDKALDPFIFCTKCNFLQVLLLGRDRREQPAHFLAVFEMQPCLHSKKGPHSWGRP